MRANIGNIDRLLRFVLGLVAVAGLFIGPFAAGNGWGPPQFFLAVAAAILIGTSAVKFCPAYRVFSIRTSKSE